jgi:hypothetical protein
VTVKEVIGRIALCCSVATTGALAGCGSLAAGSHQGHGSEQPLVSQSPAPVATKPPAGYVPTFAPCAPIVLPTMGIDNSSVQVGPGSWDDFVTANQWTGPVGSSSTESYVVWAGATGDAAVPPGVPAVAVDIRTVGSDGCSTQTTVVGVFTDGPARGPLEITSVRDGLVYLSARSGSPVAFSLLTHRYTPV